VSAILSSSNSLIGTPAAVAGVEGAPPFANRIASAPTRFESTVFRSCFSTHQKYCQWFVRGMRGAARVVERDMPLPCPDTLLQAVYWWMAANPSLSKTRAHAKNVYLLYFFWLLGLLLQLLQRICIDTAPISSLKSLYVLPTICTVFALPCRRCCT